MISPLDAVDDVLMIGGAIVLGTFAVWAWRRGGDPLRGSPIRRQKVEPIVLMATLMAYAVSAQIALWLTSGMGAGLAGDQAEAAALWRNVVSMNLVQALMIGVCLFVGHRAFAGGWRGFGITGGSVVRDARNLLAGWLAALLVAGVVSVLTGLVIERVWPKYTPDEHAVFETLNQASTPGWIRVVAILGAGVLAPVGEELFFRGILQSALYRVWPRERSYLHRWFALLAAGTVFGLMHSPVPHHVPALIALGILLGFLYERTGSLRVVIGVHVLFNAKSLLWFFLEARQG